MSEKARGGTQFSPHARQRLAKLSFQLGLGTAREGHKLERPKLMLGELTENFLEK